MEKEFDISITTLKNLLTGMPFALTSVPKWYHNVTVVKELIKDNLESLDGHNKYTISLVLPMLFYIENDMEGLKRLLSQLTLKEQLFLFNPDFFPTYTIVDRPEYTEVAHEGLKFIFDINPLFKDWDKPDTFILMADNKDYYKSNTGIATMLVKSGVLKKVANGGGIIGIESFKEPSFWEEIESIEKRIKKAIILTNRETDTLKNQIDLFIAKSDSETLKPYFLKYHWDIKGTPLLRQMAEYVTNPKLLATVDLKESKIKVFILGKFIKFTSILTDSLTKYTARTQEIFKEMGFPIYKQDSGYSYDGLALSNFAILVKSIPIANIQFIPFNYWENQE